VRSTYTKDLHIRSKPAGAVTGCPSGWSNGLSGWFTSQRKEPWHFLRQAGTVTMCRSCRPTPLNILPPTPTNPAEMHRSGQCSYLSCMSALRGPAQLVCRCPTKSEGTHLARGDKLGLKECACPEEHSPVLHLLKKRRSD
jgi:hypothetical protein